MKMINSFDPSAAASGSFKHQIANPCGGVYLFNESNEWLQLTLPDGGNVGLPAWWARFYYLANVQGPITWQVLATIATVASPLSQVYGESYERNEVAGRTFYDGPIPRNPYIGNQVMSSVSTNQVINDGNPAVTNVIESTQQGNTGGSNLSMNNDGSFLFAQWVSSVYTNLFQLIPGASPLLRLGAKLILEAVDNSGANLSNIFGVDSSGNTFLQNHKTNNQTVIYDKNGVAIAVFDANDMVNFPGVKQTVNGDTSGTMDVYEFLSGNIKLVALVQTNYRQAGTGQLITLKKPFAVSAGIFNFGAGGIVYATSGVVGTGRQITWGTGTSAGSQNNNAQIPQDAAGFSVGSGFNQVGDAGGYAASHGGLGIYVGV